MLTVDVGGNAFLQLDRSYKTAEVGDWLVKKNFGITFPLPKKSRSSKLLRLFLR